MNPHFLKLTKSRAMKLESWPLLARSLAINEFIADKADVISSRPDWNICGTELSKCKTSRYLTFVHSWIEEERKDYAGVYGLVNWLVPYRAPVNKIIFFLKPVRKIQNDVVVFSNLPHPHPKKINFYSTR